ncbi:hypothetical protein An13g02870 [Aspergillus niger]|uniref:Uncharacterized protein n=2 Tax=Aspergillus niger TaxID=5061 RepID=A2R1Y3_ASPNC|nr:hypothetical protein An13g02870 [Aspergillus niger]CAK41683.1 hypothetical protein An13g02870 [Aspergillus niger]
MQRPGKRTGLLVDAETVQGFLEPDGGLCPPDSRIDGRSSKEWNSDWTGSGDDTSALAMSSGGLCPPDSRIMLVANDSYQLKAKVVADEMKLRLIVLLSFEKRITRFPKLIDEALNGTSASDMSPGGLCPPVHAR